MAFRSPLLMLLAAALCLSLCTALSIDRRRDLHLETPRSISRTWETVETLWKRRIHSSDADSDADTDSTSSSQSSSSNNDDDDDDTSSSSSSTCTNVRNKTRIIYNDDGYSSYYSSGIGSKNSTAGGTTPDGSGTAPKFDNSTGAWVTLADDAAANNVSIDNQKYLSYLGGAATPFKSGDDSPSGLSPKHLTDLAFTTVNEDSISDGSCAVPNTSYAYVYESKYSLTTGDVPVYCACDPYGLCGCDDAHSNSSFVPAMLGYLGLETEAKNVSRVCTVLIDGTTTILVDGGLSNGSTKADPNADSVLVRVPRSTSGRCGSGGGGSAAPMSMSVNSGLLLAWTGILSVAMVFGMTLFGI
ncbi:hypothetical protein BJX99DRAFT_230544 [Aspergillus californicus]